MSKIHLGSTERKGVCVIGAGISGLIAIKYLKKDGLDVLAIEAKSDIGGTWNISTPREISQKHLKELYNHYTPEIYAKLNTNVNYVCMTLKDMAYQCEPTTIIASGDFYEYLQAYVDKFELRQHILFNKIVSKVRLISNLSQDEIKEYKIDTDDLKYRYLIRIADTTKSIEDDLNQCKEMFVFCDYIVCCNGVYTIPFIPSITDRHLYKAEEIHTTDYTDMESLRQKLENKRVVVVGSCISGRDVINHIVLGFKDHKPINTKSLTFVLSNAEHLEGYKKAEENYKEHVGILKIVVGPVIAFKGPNTLITKDEAVDADIVIWATGFRYSLPFIEPTDQIVEVEETESRGRYLHPMYLMTFSINQPTFAKLSIPYVYKAELILNLERQMTMISAVFSGRVQLPDKEKMKKSLENHLNRLKEKGHDLKSFHREIKGYIKQGHILDKWFKYSGCAERDYELDNFMEELNRNNFAYLGNGGFFGATQLSNKDLVYKGQLSSDKF